MHITLEATVCFHHALSIAPKVDATLSTSIVCWKLSPYVPRTSHTLGSCLKIAVGSRLEKSCLSFMDTGRERCPALPKSHECGFRPRFEL